MKYTSVQLGTYVQVIGGYAFPSDSYTDKGVPVIRISDIQGGLVSAKKAAKIPKEMAGKGWDYQIELGDILIAMSGATTGKIGLVADDFNGPFLQNQRVGNFRILDSNKVDKIYLRHFLTSPNYQLQLINLMAGAAQPNISSKQLESIEIPLPPLDEQRRIAAILDKADSIRRKRQESIRLTEEFLRSTFLDMFGDPVTNPKGWEVSKFEKVGSLDRGVSKHRPRNAPELLGGPYPLIQTGDVANSDGYIRNYKSSYSEIGLKQSKIWPSGTLCITIAANIAKTGILTFDSCFPDSVVAFSPNALATTEYVQYWLSFLQKILEDTAPESAQKNINLEILRNLDIPLPPLELQKKFSKHLKNVQEMKVKQTAGIAYVDTLFNSLTHRAFRGEL